MTDDEDFRVRFTCAERLTPALVERLADDPDATVREVALARLGEALAAAAAEPQDDTDPTEAGES